MLDGLFPIAAADGAIHEREHAYLRDVATIFAIDEAGSVPAHYVPKDSPLVRQLIASDERVKGVHKEPIAIGGGTYAHGLPNAVAFGCAEADVDNHMHGPDEFMIVEEILKSAKIFADAIMNLCNAPEGGA